MSKKTKIFFWLSMLFSGICVTLLLWHCSFFETIYEATLKPIDALKFCALSFLSVIGIIFTLLAVFITEKKDRYLQDLKVRKTF